MAGPATWTERAIVDKFPACASGVTSGATAEAIVKTILSLEDAGSISPLTERLSGPSRGR